MRGSEIVFIAEKAHEDGYEAWALGHSIYIQGETMEDLKEAVRDAVRCHVAEVDLPWGIRLHLAREAVLSHRDATGIWQTLHPGQVLSPTLREQDLSSLLGSSWYLTLPQPPLFGGRTPRTRLTESHDGVVQSGLCCYDRAVLLDGGVGQRAQS